MRPSGTVTSLDTYRRLAAGRRGQPERPRPPPSGDAEVVALPAASAPHSRDAPSRARLDEAIGLLGHTQQRLAEAQASLTRIVAGLPADDALRRHPVLDRPQRVLANQDWELGVLHRRVAADGLGLRVVAENLTAASSPLRDPAVAAGLTGRLRLQLLAQRNAALRAQANTASHTVTDLLR